MLMSWDSSLTAGLWFYFWNDESVVSGRMLLPIIYDSLTSSISTCFWSNLKLFCLTGDSLSLDGLILEGLFFDGLTVVETVWAVLVSLRSMSVIVILLKFSGTWRTGLIELWFRTFDDMNEVASKFSSAFRRSFEVISRLVSAIFRSWEVASRSV